MMSRKKVAGRDDGDETKFSWLGNGRSFSKNLLYTPLIAYKKALNKASNDDRSSSQEKYQPSEYMSSRTSVPKSLQESSFVSFLHAVSCHYHGSLAKASDAKNNGSRPLGLSDIEERTRQRAITLMGGGINSSITVKKKPPPSKKRRRRTWEKTRNGLESYLPSTSGDDVLSFLTKLNTTWNKYICDLLMKDTMYKKEVDTRSVSVQELERKLIVLSKNWIRSQERIAGNNNGSENITKPRNGTFCPFELVGSHIQITQCRSHPGWVGRFGILIGETANTYRIAGCPSRRRRKRNNRKKSRKQTNCSKNENVASKDGVDDIEADANSVVEHNVYNNSSEEDRLTKQNIKAIPTVSESSIVEVFMLPKSGSSFQLIIPLSVQERMIADGGQPKAENKTKNHMPRSVIPLSEESICIAIENAGAIL